MAEVEWRRILDLDCIHPGERRPASATLDQLRYRRWRAGDQNLNRAVEPVADPAVETESQGPPFDPYAKTNFLDDAANHQPLNLARFNRHERSLRSYSALFRATPSAPDSADSVTETQHRALPVSRHPGSRAAAGRTPARAQYKPALHDAGGATPPPWLWH